MSSIDNAWIEGLPKIELHVHVEGAILPETLFRLAKRNGIDLPARNLEELRAWYKFTDFPHFAEIYQTFSKAITSAEDIHDMVWDFVKEQARQNIRHSEATFTALTHYRNNGIPFEEQLDAVRQAADRGLSELGTSLGLIIDIPRELATPGEALLIANWVAGAHGDGLVLALGLSGYEPGFPPEMFLAPFALAAEAKVPAVVHGGETGPAAYVSGAITSLGAVRVGHGISAVDDSNVLALVKERGVTLEVCPSSNVCLKLVETIERHPFRRLADQGVDVTINTDDPPMFETDLNNEYRRLAETFHYSKADLKRFALRAARASLLDDSRRATLVAEIERYSE